MNKLARIEEAIGRTTDRKTLRLLNRAWWFEWFRLRNLNGRAIQKAQP